MINCDILTNLKFKDLLDYHSKNKSFATMCIYEKEFKMILGLLGQEEIN